MEEYASILRVFVPPCLRGSNKNFLKHKGTKAQRHGDSNARVSRSDRREK